MSVSETSHEFESGVVSASTSDISTISKANTMSEVQSSLVEATKNLMESIHKFGTTFDNKQASEEPMESYKAFRFLDVTNKAIQMLEESSKSIESTMGNDSTLTELSPPRTKKMKTITSPSAIAMSEMMSKVGAFVGFAFVQENLYQTAPNTRTTEGKKNMLKKIRSRIDDSLDELNCKRRRILKAIENSKSEESNQPKHTPKTTKEMNLVNKVRGDDSEWKFVDLRKKERDLIETVRTNPNQWDYVNLSVNEKDVINAYRDKKHAKFFDDYLQNHVQADN